MSYIVSTAYPLTLTAKDGDGALVDPDSVIAYSYSPSQAVLPITMTRQSLGVYTGTWEPDAAGPWLLSAKTTNPDIRAADIKATVQASFPIP